MTRSTTANRRVAGWSVALALILAVSLAACGGSSTSSSSGKAPIKVMMIGTISSVAFSFPETVSAAQALATETNAAGGINGHMIDILTCNDQIDPNVAASCARSAVADNVSAVLAIETDYQPQVISTILPAHMAYIGDNAGNPPELTGSNVFLLGAGSYGAFSSGGTVAVQLAGCKKVSVVALNIPATEISANNIKASVEAAGGSVTNIADIAPTLPDYSSLVATAIGDGAQCIATVLGPAQILGLLAAIKSSSKPNLPLEGEGAGLFTTAEFNQVKNQLNGGFVTSDTYDLPLSQVSGPPPSNMTAFLAAMKKYAPSAMVDLTSLQGWDSMTMFIDAARKAKNYDASSILAAMGTLSNITLAGVPVPVSFTTPNPNPLMSRVTDTTELVYKMVNGLYQLQPTKIDVQQGLGAFLAQK